MGLLGMVRRTSCGRRGASTHVRRYSFSSFFFYGSDFCCYSSVAVEAVLATTWSIMASLFLLKRGRGSQGTPPIMAARCRLASHEVVRRSRGRSGCFYGRPWQSGFPPARCVSSSIVDANSS